MDDWGAVKPEVTLGSIVSDGSDDFFDFDLTEIQKVLSNLANTDAIDLPHAELLQQQALRGADILCEYLGRLVKISGKLETEISSKKNKISLNYQAPEGIRTTADMKKSAGESAPEVVELQNKLAEAKGAKTLIEKKYDILIRQHHHYKEIAAGLRRTILGL